MAALSLIDMRNNLVVANWKMYGSKASVTQLLTALKQGIAVDTDWQTDIVICPPSLFLEQVQQELAGTVIGVGAQNAHPQTQGAYTGEIAMSMLREFSCSHVIIGHSERREIFSESDSFIAEKFIAAQENGLIPILCIGETQEQREQGQTETVVLKQIEAVIDAAGIAAFTDAVIAYEPIWAIGTGLTASPEQAQEVHVTIRLKLAQLDKSVAENISILYGGSVKASNAKDLFSQTDVDGALVGGASLVAEEFLSICTAA